MTASDGELPRLGVGVAHPRAYGTFPRKLGRYARDERVVTLEHAVRSMTSLPATVFRMTDRGVLRAGAVADVVVLDADRIRDRATYDEPHQLAEGVMHVLIGGRFSVRDGRATGALNGRVLDRTAR
jgi:N-acyl-D-aspartate/D-glutamate deacylase